MASTQDEQMNFKSIPDRFDRGVFIVTGYMHDNNQRSFLLDLIKIIVSYYLQRDQWDSKHKGESLSILEETRLLQTKDRCHACAYGIEEISNSRYEWIIRVNKYKYPVEGYWHIYAGVINTDIADMAVRANNAPEFAGCYSFDVTKGSIANEKNIYTKFKRKVTKAGDIIEILLDLENKTVCCKINDKDVEESIEIKEGKYRLLVSLYFDKTELELL